MTIPQHIINFLLVAGLFFAGSHARSDEVLLRFDRLVDGTGQMLPHREILIDHRIIVAIGDGLESRYPSAEIVELKGLTAIPGLIESGVVSGPRLFLAGPGLHTLTLPPIPEGQSRDIVADFSQQARERVDAGVDWIKIFATTGSAEDLSGDQVFFYPEIRAVTDIAHEAGIRVAVHSYGPSAVPDALRARVDSIEHAVGMSDELLQMWAETDVIYVPTVDHNRYYADFREEYGYDEVVEAQLRLFVERNTETLRRAHEHGIQIAMGSDAVMTMFGQSSRELEWFVEAGMTPGEALRTATSNGARLLGQENTLGRLAEGYTADIVAVEGDPLVDIRAVTRGVKWVMKGGVVVMCASHCR